ncbi:MAG: metal-dependent transcriptional regulator [bacterium]|nr:metal-dependent transcriptional regulator [bacterium]
MNEELEELITEFYHKVYEKKQDFEKEKAKKLEDEGLLNNGELTQEAKVIAISLLRRERLSERLLFDVLGLDLDTSTLASCMLEHVISEKIADAICTLLGHPTICVHGFEIPAGECCKKKEQRVNYVITPLVSADHGKNYRISYISIKDSRVLSRLISCGVRPGEVIKLITKFPSYVVEVSGTQIAFEKEIAELIFVREL